MFRQPNVIIHPRKPLVTGILSLFIVASCGGKGDANHSSQTSITSSSSSSVSSINISSAIASSQATASSAAATNLSCIGQPLASGYCLVWQDEFDSNSLNQNQWSYEKNCSGGGNNEAQCYVESANNVWVDGDLLHIKASRENATGPSLQDDNPDYNALDTSGSGSYTSGRIRSIGKGDWTYGRFEIKAKLPAGQGTWPAIWMLPTDWVYGGWASSGEIDIMEAVNLKVGDENRIHGTLHFGDNWPSNVYAGTEYTLPNSASPADDFHVYSVEWEQDEIRWYVDDVHYATQTSAGWYSAAALDTQSAPFNQRFHLILNLAVGGDWAANTNNMGIDETVFPQEMQIDYVRVYQCTNNPINGKGCATKGENYIANPGITPPQPIDTTMNLPVFNGASIAPFTWGAYSAEGTVDFKIVDAGGNHGTVGEVTFNTQAGVGFFQSTSNIDLSDFESIEFDLRVTQNTNASELAPEHPLIFRADCSWPCTSGDYSIGVPTINTWSHYKIPLTELASAGLDLTNVNSVFVISPTIDNQMGVVLQIDNIVVSH